MFTKKLEDQFSANLLNTVRGILGEAKHDKECECEKCEEEDEDEEDEDEAEEENGKKKMKEGYVSAAQRKAIWANYADGGAGHPDKKKKMKKEGYAPTADEPTEANKKVAQKVRDMMAKEKKPVKEESEELGEVSKATLGRYINKAKDSIDMASYRQGHKEAHGSSSKPLEKKLTKRHKGIETAVKKLTKEDAEQIDELSKDALASYTVNAARDLPRLAGKRQAEIRKTGIGASDRKIKNRIKGIDTAADRLRNEEVEQLDELSPKTLSSYAKKAVNQSFGKGIAGGAALASTDKDTETQGHKLVNKAAKRMQGAQKAISKLTKEEQEFIDSLNNDMFEEIEIAEANLKVGDYTATSEKSKFHKNGYRPHLKNAQGKTSYLAGVAYKSPEHAAGEAAAYHKGYTSGPGKASERGADDAVRAYRHKNKEHMHEEIELEEGRGRPPKEGSAAWHAKQKQASDDMVSLGMQLRKAKSINKKVRFMDNKEHDIHPNHINRFDDHMAARRTTQEKDKFQRQAHKSHAEFVKAVSAPVPKAAKDTGEIVKYRH